NVFHNAVTVYDTLLLALLCSCFPSPPHLNVNLTLKILPDYRFDQISASNYTFFYFHYVSNFLICD
ncbi:hypothetical protein L9F63_015111, partial [Diploptera punctata]